ncbi:MAG TPA: ABC transporter permease [Puia sp.]|jgi:putative ABC transport system permease protein|nr:ABC transporter permease [Puia sp.]
MIKNYFKTAWRNLGKNKMHSFINIAGLSIGMAVAMLIGLWIYDEVSFDKNFDNYNRIAQVIQNVTNNGEVQTWTSVPYPLADELRKNYGSDFKHIVMVINWSDHIININEKKFKENGGYFEKEAPEMFSFKMLQGSRSGLDDPTSVMISASSAKAYFGNENPINKIIKIDDQPPVKVTGVYEDFPRNSTLAGLNFVSTVDLLTKIDSGFRTMPDPWRPNFTTLFVQLNDNSEIDKVDARIKDAKLKRVNPQLAKKKPALFLQPMSKWHLYSEFKNGVNVGGDIQYVWMFGIIGVFVLLLACINFMNLSTARSEKRAKEVGIRKTVGSLRSQLIVQFFNESLLTVLFAFTLSLLLVQLTLPFFNLVSNKQMTILWNNPFFWLLGIGFAIITAIIAGSYPAFYLSSFQPVKVLKGTFKAGRFAAIPRKALVVLQFTVSVTLIIGTIVVYRQIQFTKNRPVGYNREGLVSIPTMNPAIHNHFDAVKNELMKTGVITSVAEAESPTTGIWNSTSGISWPGKDPNLSTDFGVVTASFDYGKTIGWKIKEGRSFSKDFASDTSAFILNEAAVRFMNLKNPVGSIITWWDKKFTVIGVAENMVMRSPYDEVTPVIYSVLNYPGNLAILKIKPTANVKDALSKIEPVFKSFNPDQPFEYTFVDDDYEKKFTYEERISKLASFFAILAVAISCLGLFGLTSFVAEQRKKEIGVRKVLGASVLNVWNLLSKDFVMLVIISFVISVPLSYYFMSKWLLNYHYRAELSWWIFLAAGIGSLAITIAVVSFQAIKAAVANPVKSLRTE